MPINEANTSSLISWEATSTAKRLGEVKALIILSLWMDEIEEIARFHSSEVCSIHNHVIIEEDILN